MVEARFRHPRLIIEGGWRLSIAEMEMETKASEDHRRQSNESALHPEVTPKSGGFCPIHRLWRILVPHPRGWNSGAGAPVRERNPRGPPPLGILQYIHL
jgi:hypothetical protein